MGCCRDSSGALQFSILPRENFLPLDLSPLYPLHGFTGIWELQWLLSGVLVLLLSAGFFLARRRWPGGLAAWVFMWCF